MLLPCSTPAYKLPTPTRPHCEPPTGCSSVCCSPNSSRSTGAPSATTARASRWQSCWDCATAACEWRVTQVPVQTKTQTWRRLLARNLSHKHNWLKRITLSTKQLSTHTVYSRKRIKALKRATHIHTQVLGRRQAAGAGDHRDCAERDGRHVQVRHTYSHIELNPRLPFRLGSAAC